LEVLFPSVTVSALVTVDPELKVAFVIVVDVTVPVTVETLVDAAVPVTVTVVEGTRVDVEIDTVVEVVVEVEVAVEVAVTVTTSGEMSSSTVSPLRATGGMAAATTTTTVCPTLPGWPTKPDRIAGSCTKPVPLGRGVVEAPFPESPIAELLGVVPAAKEMASRIRSVSAPRRMRKPILRGAFFDDPNGDTLPVGWALVIRALSLPVSPSSNSMVTIIRYHSGTEEARCCVIVDFCGTTMGAGPLNLELIATNPTMTATKTTTTP
jgi:hypothetical protein